VRVPCYLHNGNGPRKPDYLESIELDKLGSTAGEEVAYWILDARENQSVEELIGQVRRHPDPEVYLKPIVVLTDQHSTKQQEHAQADEIVVAEQFDKEEAEACISRFENILHWIDHLPRGGEYVDTNVPLRLLRFIASRNREMVPVMSANRLNGYVYPMLDPFLENSVIGIQETLDFLQGQKLLTGRFITKSHFCSHCDCAFLNFEEVCPHCDARDIRVDELVHHFKCAYTGELSEFKVGDHLQCPKCERTLQHIGVDYDKPSIVYQCNECSHTFQDPKIMTTCFNCGRRADPEHQVSRAIEAYTITALGQNTALYGMESLFTNILETDIKLFSYAAFQDFFQVEISRIKRYKRSHSALAMVEFRGLDQLYVRLGKRAKDVFAELSAIFKTIFRTSDVITARNESLFMIIMTETTESQGRIAIDRLEAGIRELFQANLQIQVEMKFMIEEIREDTDASSTLERFLQNAPV
jgi:GGDEF domain-containing protein